MAGFATSPLALTPFGTGTPVSGTAPPSSVPTEALFLDPRTKDFALDSEGAYKRMPTTRHRVLVALTTRKGSNAADANAGIDIPRKIGTNYAQKMRIAVSNALRFLVDEGAISLEDVTTETSGGRVVATVDYVDLLSGEKDRLVL
jgi:hypothetical protein